jgi:hypothetical protein
LLFHYSILFFDKKIGADSAEARAREILSDLGFSKKQLFSNGVFQVVGVW